MAETLINKNQAGSGIWTSDTLKAGKNIELVQKINPYVISESTLALWHGASLNADYVNETYFGTGTTLSITDKPSGDFYGSTGGKFNLGQIASSANDKRVFIKNSGAEVSFAIPIVTVDFWYLPSNKYATIGMSIPNANNSSDSPSVDLTYSNQLLYFRRYSRVGNVGDISIPYTSSWGGYWHHLAFTTDTVANKAYCYVDGTYIGEWNAGLNDNQKTLVISSSLFPCIGGFTYRDSDKLSEIRWTLGDVYQKQNYTVPTEPYSLSSAGNYYEINNKLKAGTNITIASDGTISATDTTYTAFTGTDGSSAGTMGLVPAPATTDADKYLKSDGTWEEVSGNVPEGVYTQDNLVAGDCISLQHSSDQPTVNYELVGNPTITSDYVASGFSSASYVKGPLAPSDPVTSFQIDCKVITPSSFSPYEPIFGQIVTNKTTPQVSFEDGEILFEVSPDGSSWTSLTVPTSGNFSTNTQYYIRFTWDGSYIKIFTSSDGESYSQIGSHACSGCFWNQQLGIGADIGDPYSGSIYLSDFKIYVNDSLYWEAVTPGGITRINTDFTGVSGYDATKTQVLKNVNGTLTWVDEA